MSDGGLCSNFPIHLFDSFRTQVADIRNRFAEPQQGIAPRVCLLPEKHYEGRGALGTGRPESKEPFGRAGGFLVSFARSLALERPTMMRCPVCGTASFRFSWREGEGGVNIKMSKQAIDGLTRKYGKPAAGAFLKKFAADGQPRLAGAPLGALHRLLIALRQQSKASSCGPDLDRYTPTSDAQIEESRKTAPLLGTARGCPSPSERPLGHDQAGELEVSSPRCGTRGELSQAGD